VEEFHGQLKIGGGKKKSAPRLEGERKKKKKKIRRQIGVARFCGGLLKQILKLFSSN
jgi:hypothetical protein